MAAWQLQRRMLSLFSTRRPHSSLSNGFSDILKGQACIHDNAVPQFIGNFGTKLGCTKVKENLSPPFALSFRSFIHSVGPNEFETGRNIRSNEFETGRNIRSNDFETGRNIRSNEFETGRNTRSMNFVRGIIEENGRDVMGVPEYRSGVEQNADIVHVKMIRNNTFVTLTDSKGNKKAGASSGCLAEMKGGPKVSRYAAEATAEHVGRLARNMGLKSVVIKVNGFTYFKKKKQAILSFREGYTHSRGDQNPIVYIEDTTRRPHNGCRLRKKRRV